MVDYLSIYDAAFKSGDVSNETIRKYVKQFTQIDRAIPETRTFNYLHEIKNKNIWFLGKQQELVTGVSNEESFNQGLDFAFERIHPDDLGIVLNQVYPTFQKILEANTGNPGQVFAQYNYRIRHVSGEYRNLLERVFILELDDCGIPSLLLGNVTMIGSQREIPVCFIGRSLTESGESQLLALKAYSEESQILESITRREVQILRSLAAGKTSRTIADELFISKHTVDTHRRTLLKKLACKSTVGLAQFVFDHHL